VHVQYRQHGPNRIFYSTIIFTRIAPFEWEAKLLMIGIGTSLVSFNVITDYSFCCPVEEQVLCYSFYIFFVTNFSDVDHIFVSIYFFLLYECLHLFIKNDLPLAFLLVIIHVETLMTRHPEVPR